MSSDLFDGPPTFLAGLDGALYFFARRGSAVDLWSMSPDDAIPRLRVPLGASTLPQYSPSAVIDGWLFLPDPDAPVVLRTNGTIVETAADIRPIDLGQVDERLVGLGGSLASLWSLEPETGTLTHFDATARWYFSQADGRLVFPGREPAEVVWTDGTRDGTMVTVPTAGASSDPRYLRVRDDGERVVFQIKSGADAGWWQTDGTAGGTVPTEPPNVPPWYRTAELGDLVFCWCEGGVVVSDDDGTTWTLLWTAPEGASGPFAFTSHGEHVYFGFLVAEQGWPLASSHLWMSDGTVAGTVPLAESLAAPFEEACVAGDPWCGWPSAELVFLGDTGIVASGMDIWAVPPDGPPTILRQVGYPTDSHVPLYLFRDRVVWSELHQEPGPSYERTTELWSSDGTPQGTGPTATIEGWIPTLGPVGRQAIYFVGTDPAHGRELWRTDLTDRGTRRLADVFPGRASSDPRHLVVDSEPGRRDRLYFEANDGRHGRELWASDGSTAGTRLVADTWPGRGSGGFDSRGLLGGELWFVAASPRTGRELWRTNGRRTILAVDADPGPASGNPRHLTPLASRILFTARTEAEGRELWVMPRPGTRLQVEDR